MKLKKIPASISLDLDNQWSYMKIHGDSGWEEFPSYLDTFVPHVLKMLDEFELKITFFIVGQDAALDKNRNAIKSISYLGHEIGNHSFNHESWLHKYSKEKVRIEILKAEDSIIKLCEQKPLGFRGPGFSCSYDLLNVLFENGYTYDASSLPTYIGPLARLYYFWSSNLSKEEKEDRNELFGNFKDGLRPVKPYFYKLNGSDKILEIPVSTIPIIKIPFHLSYLLYLSRISNKLMHMYLDAAIRACKLTGTKPSFLLHPLDLIGGDQIKELKFFPGMDINSDIKKQIFREVIEKLMKHFQLMNMSKFADVIKNSNEVKIIRSFKPVINY